jgi:murein DD-endopeptidase MepM/ murein hydrolase activator NlpD
MSLISKDFRLQEQREQQHGHARLRWALFAIACAGIGVVVASTNTEESNATAEIATSALPELVAAKKSPEELARDSFSLTLPELQARQSLNNEENASEPELSPKQWREFIVKSGDSLAQLFKRADIKPQQLDELMKSGDAVKKLQRIFPKDTIRVLSNNDGVLQELRYDIDQKSYLIVERKQGELVAQVYNHKIETRQTHASGVITSSLFLAAQKAGISQNVTMELANIFGWDIDFILDIRKGDNFTVLYEELYRNGEKISDGEILAADFVNNGKIYRAIRYTNPQTDKSEYYTPDGKSMRKAFIRTPLNFARISSGFNLKRKHPILLNKRPHKGVDYAAKSGTPIYAAGDGKVIFKGKKGGYGKVMILQHGTKYTTLYAHLKTYNRKLKNGSRVKQGQTIAYVGSTGLATGPHLHYEFRVNGVHRNPLTVSLPVSNPVPKKHMADFDQVTSPIVAQLDSLTRPQQFALTDN